MLVPVWWGLAALALALTGCAQNEASESPTVHAGKTMAGWQIAVGDGLYTAPGEEPVNLSDIRTTHADTHTTVEANVLGRDVMAHNITYAWERGGGVDEAVQVFETDVRLPYVPVASGDAAYNPQTIEAQVGSWDGERDAICAVQWRINPYTAEYGAVALWTPGHNEIGEWTIVDSLPVDTRWQRWVFEIDPNARRCAYTIDGRTYAAPTPLNAKPGWGSLEGAHVGIEIISIYPGTGEAAIRGKPHYAEFKEWRWTIDPRRP